MSMRFDEDEFPAENHEINVTPFIDVMLVLLIIFMVCAPLATVDVPVNLPASNAAAVPPPQAPVFVTLQADASIAVNDTVIDPDGFAAAVDQATNNNHDERIFLRADSRVSYKELMGVMDRLRDAGYLKISLLALDGSTQ